MKAFAASILSAALLSGCVGPIGLIDQTTAGDPSDHESIIVMKISPEQYRPHLVPGKMENGKLIISHFDSVVISAMPKDGYVVGKAEAGLMLALRGVEEIKYANAVFTKGQKFYACKGIDAMVFEVPKGKVLYLTDIHFEHMGKSLSVAFKQDIEGAEQYLRQNFPGIHGKVEQVNFKFIPTGGSSACPREFNYISR